LREPDGVLPFNHTLFDQTIVCKICAEELYGSFCIIRERARHHAICTDCTDLIQTRCPVMRHPVSISQRVEICNGAGLLCPVAHSVCRAAADGAHVATIGSRQVVLLGNPVEYIAVDDPVWLLATQRCETKVIKLGSWRMS
jgi:hypothetical protein